MACSKMGCSEGHSSGSCILVRMNRPVKTAVPLKVCVIRVAIVFCDPEHREIVYAGHFPFYAFNIGAA